MKLSLTSLEIHHLIRELGVLAGSRVDNIYSPEKEELLLQLHSSGRGKQILRIISGKLFYLASSRKHSKEGEHSKEHSLSGFCIFLRKHLNNSRLKGIRQLGSERIIEILFERLSFHHSLSGGRTNLEKMRGDRASVSGRACPRSLTEGVSEHFDKAKEEKRLIIELFGGGNILLCDKENIILSALAYHRWRDREILAKRRYSYPQKEYNLFELKLNELAKILMKSDKSLVKCLAADLGLGGTYSEEACLLAGIDKNAKSSGLSEKDINELFKQIKSLVDNDSKDSSKDRIKPLIVYRGKEEWADKLDNGGEKGGREKKGKDKQEKWREDAGGNKGDDNVDNKVDTIKGDNKKDTQRDEVIDIIPFELKIYKKETSKKESESMREEKKREEKKEEKWFKQFNTYNEAFDFYFLNCFKEERPKTKSEAEIEKLKRRLKAQEEALAGLMGELEEERMKAELLYQNYELVNNALLEVRKSVERHSWKEAEKRLEGDKFIKSLNPKDKTIDIEVG